MTSKKDLDGPEKGCQNSPEVGEPLDFETLLLKALVEPGTVYDCEDPESFGVIPVRPAPFAVDDINAEAGLFPVRQDIEVLPADEPKQLKLGWIVHEYIGVQAIAKCGKSKKITIVE